jgi:four helix bundle protein
VKPYRLLAFNRHHLRLKDAGLPICTIQIRLMLPYERLTAWQICYRLVLETYRTTECLPKAELYGLTSQARRAAFSAAVNIAEGSAKRGPREFRRFLDISIGSLAELAFTLRLSRDLGYLSTEDWERLDELRRRSGFLVWRLYRSLSKKGRQESP